MLKLTHSCLPNNGVWANQMLRIRKMRNGIHRALCGPHASRDDESFGTCLGRQIRRVYVELGSYVPPECTHPLYLFYAPGIPSWLLNCGYRKQRPPSIFRELGSTLTFIYSFRHQCKYFLLSFRMWKGNNCSLFWFTYTQMTGLKATQYIWFEWALRWMPLLC